MPDRYSRPGDPTPRELRDAMEAALLHGRFTVSARDLEGRKVIVVVCQCTRRLEMLDSLDSGILLWWLADHDDDMFLTEAERDMRSSAQLTKEQVSKLSELISELPAFPAGQTSAERMAALAKGAGFGEAPKVADDD